MINKELSKAYGKLSVDVTENYSYFVKALYHATDDKEKVAKIMKVAEDLFDVLENIDKKAKELDIEL